MTNLDVIYISLFSGLAGGFYSFMLIAYDNLQSIPTKEEVEKKLKSEKRLMFLVLRLLLASLTTLIFSLYFWDDALNGDISRSKLAFYLSVLCIGTTGLMDISKILNKLLNKYIINS